MIRYTVGIGRLTTRLGIDIRMDNAVVILGANSIGAARSIAGSCNAADKGIIVVKTTITAAKDAYRVASGSDCPLGIAAGFI